MAGDRRACIHIGMPKTATTSIQAAFFHTRALLESDADILYPGKQPNHSQPLYSLFCDNPLDYDNHIRAGIRTMERISAINAENQTLFERQITSSSARTVFLSGESLSLLSEAGVSRFKRWLENFFSEFRIIMVLRDPVAWASSEAQKNILGGSGTMARVLQHPPLPRFRRRLEKFCQAFGRDSIHLIDFHSARQGAGGIAGRFADYFSLPPHVRQALATATQHHNPSMSHEATLLISALNEAVPLKKKDGAGPGRFQGDIAFLSRISGPTFRLPVEALRRVRTGSASDLDWLRQEFGFVFTADDDGLHDATDDVHLFSDATLLSLASSFWKEISRERAESLFQRALRLQLEGKGGQAAECLMECLRVNPEHQGAQRLSAKLNTASSD